MQIKEARDGARGPGDLGLRGPERSVDIELSSPGRARKKERYRFGIVQTVDKAPSCEGAFLVP